MSDNYLKRLPDRTLEDTFFENYSYHCFKRMKSAEKYLEFVPYSKTFIKRMATS